MTNPIRVAIATVISKHRPVYCNLNNATGEWEEHLADQIIAELRLQPADDKFLNTAAHRYITRWVQNA